MTWDGEGRRPIRDKQAEKDRLRKLCLAVLSEPGLRILDRMELPEELKAAEHKRVLDRLYGKK